MPHFMVDDELTLKGKFERLVEDSARGSFVGAAALGVWVAAGSKVQAAGSDGIISRLSLLKIFIDPEFVDTAAALLVAAGFWHGPGHNCSCPPVPEGSWGFHDWFQMRYKPGVEARATRGLKTERARKDLRDQVWERDQLAVARGGESQTARCAYCQCLLRRADRRGERRPEVEHVLPEALGLINLVVSCSACNSKKGNRDPWKAGLTLHLTPQHRGELQMDGRPIAQRILAFEHAEPGALFPADGTVDGVVGDPEVATSCLSAHPIARPEPASPAPLVESCSPPHGAAGLVDSGGTAAGTAPQAPAPSREPRARVEGSVDGSPHPASPCPLPDQTTDQTTDQVDINFDPAFGPRPAVDPPPRPGPVCVAIPTITDQTPDQKPIKSDPPPDPDQTTNQTQTSVPRARGPARGPGRAGQGQQLGTGSHQGQDTDKPGIGRQGRRRRRGKRGGAR